MNEYRDKCIKKKGNYCNICGEDSDIDVHHIDGDRTNNRLQNLIPVCRYCHIGIHDNRENYSHWHGKLMPWYSNSSGDLSEEYSTNGKAVSTHVLVDDLIFLEGLPSSAARRLAVMETEDVPFKCPQCGTNNNLGAEYSLNNRKACSQCDWSGPVYKGAIEAVSQNDE